MIHRQGPGERPRVAIPSKLFHTVLKMCHELPFTAHQCVRETVGLLVGNTGGKH